MRKVQTDGKGLSKMKNRVLKVKNGGTETSPIMRRK